MNEHYKAVLEDLMGRKAKLQQELGGVDAAIESLMRVFGETPTIHLEHADLRPGNGIRFRAGTAPTLVHATTAPASNQYEGLTLRWSVMWHMAEVATDWEKTGDIAKAITAGGYKPKQEKSPIGNLVSAALHHMRTTGEVETNATGGHRLTDDGRVKWSLIRQSAKFKAASSGSSAHSLLSVQ
jgi:hypothetical protein